MPPEETLKPYHGRRHFDRTPEPYGRERAEDRPVYVIQKHDASHLHYDLRLELGGVLKSWAIPKGPSMDPKVRRLALLTEDHPVEYATFEGVIPEGNYGAGTVMVWDMGTYHNIREDKPGRATMARAFENGKIEVWIDGTKLKGGFALIRTRQSEKSWLFFKMKDDQAAPGSDVTGEKLASALTGRSMDDIASSERPLH
ncbi:MAG TPA: DNA polymerase ligase N-terminal domain-containing protein [Methanocella sp.]|nr:DNA polymerase ligase N-terminal domain-containing protein [Methanocella sp.]